MSEHTIGPSSARDERLSDIPSSDCPALETASLLAWRRFLVPGVLCSRTRTNRLYGSMAGLRDRLPTRTTLNGRALGDLMSSSRNWSRAWLE